MSMEKVLEVIRDEQRAQMDYQDCVREVAQALQDIILYQMATHGDEAQKDYVLRRATQGLVFLTRTWAKEGATLQ